MRRNVSLEEISDGRLYGYHDMVKADCHGCAGCHKCCTGMGDTVILDPYDVRRLFQGTGKNLQQLLAEGKAALGVVDGCILPHLAMTGEEESCAFLDAAGRCSVHAFRPGVCRLFPLGRIYENGDFRFFLQTGECEAKNRSKIKVSRWIDTPDQEKHHRFLCRWHALLKDVESEIAGQEDGARAKQLNMELLTSFFFCEFSGEDFYAWFEACERGFRDRMNVGSRD